jgi:hypothetical protein
VGYLWTILKGGNRSTWRKNWPRATLSITKATLAVLGSNILTDVPHGFYQILQVNSETVPSVLAIPALDTVYHTQLNTSIKEKARRTVGIETWLRDERQRNRQGQRIFLFCKSRLLSNEKEGSFLWFKTARACCFQSARLRAYESIIPMSHTHSHGPSSSTGTALPSILTN